MLAFLALSSFFIALIVYYLSFRFPNFLVFMSIFVNVLDLLIILYKFGGLEFLKEVVR
jgi:preprotein translocase subunit SecF